MRLQILALLCSVGALTASPSSSQEKRLDVSYDRATITTVLNDLKARTGFNILYHGEVIPAGATVTLSKQNVTLEEVLNEALIKNGLEYNIRGEVITISQARSGAVQQPQQPQTAMPLNVTGTVSDENGRPLAGVTVVVKNTGRGTITDANGRYSLRYDPQHPTLELSFVGYKKTEIQIGGRTEVNIRLEPEVTTIDQVVITGMFNRRLESETGSSVQFSGQQLREVGNQNVLRSLSNLDPSFMIMESLEFGSDPNRLPDILFRGPSSFPSLEGDYAGNPNQPLFILDGFEVGLEMIFDLDMNRVESITILKDAAAKAIYGSKAGNGVVVIETIRPTPGSLRVSHSSTFGIEAPDLTGYNLMNAREKFEFEVLTGAYRGSGQVEMNGGQHMMDGFREQIMREVARGVDTYWLSKPLRTGFSQNHSINIQGGDNTFLYGVGASYNHIAGVMKGSDRNTFNSNLSLTYRHKNLLFRNMLEMTINNASNSPYGSFSDYAQLNPYWRSHDDEGDLIPAFSVRTQANIFRNPLYNATLNTKSTSGYNTVRNNFVAEWNILSNLRATGRFSFLHRTGESDVFLPANHTSFINMTDISRRGRYTKGYNRSTTYQADIGLSYSKIMGRHMIFSNAMWNMSDVATRSHTYIAEGFGNDMADDISFGTRYLTGSSPSGSSGNAREIGIVGAVNYSYDDRYLFDVTGRTTGSSRFGADSKWGLFWSLGLGWNIHNEEFGRNIEWLDRFKIRGSVGYTGSQDFDPYQAKAIYTYAEHVYDGGYGAILMGLPNMNLSWQRMLAYNVGTDITLWRNLSVKFDYTIEITDDALMDVDLPPSVGFSGFRENLGQIENKTFDVMLSYTPWRNAKQRGWVTVSVSAMNNKNTIKKISNNFEHRNNKANEEMESRPTMNSTALATWQTFNARYSRPSTLYYEGYSLTSRRVVRSAGINPMTGREIFWDRNGNITSWWSALDQLFIYETAPKLRGNINLSSGWKGFTLAISCRYRFGGKLYNNSLVEKLEYGNGFINLDRRITQAWTQAGQVAPYKRLDPHSSSGSTNITRPTSRFVMRDNELFISSLNVGYDFQNFQGLSNIGIERLRLSFVMNELARFSAIKVERGTSYPFANNFSIQVQATF